MQRQVAEIRALFGAEVNDVVTERMAQLAVLTGDIGDLLSQPNALQDLRSVREERPQSSVGVDLFQPPTVF